MRAEDQYSVPDHVSIGAIASLDSQVSDAIVPPWSVYIRSETAERRVCFVRDRRSDKEYRSLQLTNSVEHSCTRSTVIYS